MVNDGPIMDRYKGRPEERQEIERNWAAWEQLRAMACEPSLYNVNSARAADTAGRLNGGEISDAAAV